MLLLLIVECLDELSSGPSDPSSSMFPLNFITNGLLVGYKADISLRAPISDLSRFMEFLLSLTCW